MPDFADKLVEELDNLIKGYDYGGLNADGAAELIRKRFDEFMLDSMIQLESSAEEARLYLGDTEDA